MPPNQPRPPPAKIAVGSVAPTADPPNRLDAVAFDLRMPSHSAYIRRSLERALQFSEAHELPPLNDPEFQRALAR